MSDHDGAYKNLFSNPELVRGLLEGFVDEPWVDQVDLNTLEKVNGSYVSDKLKHRHNDIVWRVRHQEDWAYIYLLIEFQSSSDHWMALRMMTYLGLCYQDLIHQGAIKIDDSSLPPVFPVVIYNGTAPWQSPREMSELIKPVQGWAAEYMPRFRYFLLDEGRATVEPDDVSNPLSSVILFEHAKTSEEIQSLIDQVIKAFAGPRYDRLRRAYAVWLRRIIFDRVVDKEKGIKLEFESLEEAKVMLAERVEQWGVEREALGEARGATEGLSRSLLRVLTKRFGAGDYQTKLQGAGLEQLELWLDRAIDAGSIEDVFS